MFANTSPTKILMTINFSSIINLNNIKMKKIQLNKGLQINKEALSKLQDSQMKDVKGGAAAFSCGWNSCNTKTQAV